MQIQGERDKLIEAHVDYAKALALGVYKELGEPKTVDADDLIAYGMRGLTEAAERYDATRGAAFTTFAYYRIRGAVYDGLRKLGWLSRSLARLKADAGMNAYLGNQADRDVGSSAGRQTTEQAAEDLAQTLDDLTTIFLTSMDGTTDAELPDESAPGADEQLHSEQAGSAVKEALATLPERERTLLQAHYYEGLSLKEAGERVGASRSWASRLHARAIQALTRAMGPNLVAELRGT